jgi:hypothetical protein
MANDISSRQWRLDTALAFGQPGAVIWPYEINIEHIEFTGYGAQGTQAVIKDRNGKIKWSPTGAADLEEVRSGKIGWVEGLCLDTIQGGGVVTVYLR